MVLATGIHPDGSSRYAVRGLDNMRRQVGKAVHKYAHWGWKGPWYARQKTLFMHAEPGPGRFKVTEVRL